MPLHPGLDRNPVHVAALSGLVELRAGPAASHDRPGISGRPLLVDDDRTGRALPGRLLELVGPAAVVGHRITAEEGRVLGGEARVVDQHDHGLAGRVDALVVVPAVLGRDHAVADEDHLGIGDRFVFDDALGPGDEVVGPGVVEPGVAGLDREFGLSLFGQRDQGDVLEEGVAVAGLETRRLELVDQVVDGELLTGGGGGAALEFVAGEGPDGLGEGLDGHGGDARWRPGRRRPRSRRRRGRRRRAGRWGGWGGGRVR